MEQSQEPLSTCEVSYGVTLPLVAQVVPCILNTILLKYIFSWMLKDSQSKVLNNYGWIHIRLYVSRPTEKQLHLNLNKEWRE